MKYFKISFLEVSEVFTLRTKEDSHIEHVFIVFVLLHKENTLIDSHCVPFVNYSN